MSIIVIDMSPELYWYVSNALASTEIPMKHMPDSHQAEKIIYTELPDIVILNNDDPNLNVANLIGKMRNHVFARNIMFLVFSSDTSIESRRQLIIQGAAQVFYRAPGQTPPPKYFLNTVNWLLNIRKKDANKFDSQFQAIDGTGEATSWGRLGYITGGMCLIETNLDLNPGDSISITSPIFDDLGIKEPRFICMEKNKIGRYYQYANSLYGRIESKHSEQDIKKIVSWVKNNETISKSKPVKIVYFESNSDYRAEIAKMIKLDKKYCARGYKDIENFDLDLEYQKPNLILINRNLISKSKQKFDYIKKFLKNNFCYCVTYSLDDFQDINEFKKNYDMIMHSTMPIDIKLLESMVQKLEAKMPKDETDNSKVIPNKHSPYSRIAFHFEIELTALSNQSVKIKSNIPMAPFCSLEVESSKFASFKISHIQLFRVLDAKKSNKANEGYINEMLFIGTNVKETMSLNEALETLKAEKIQKS